MSEVDRGNAVGDSRARLKEHHDVTRRHPGDHAERDPAAVEASAAGCHPAPESGEGPNCRSGGRPVFIARRAAGVVPGLAVAVPVARSAAVVAAVAGLTAALLLGPPGGG